MARKHQLRVQRAGTVINVTSKKQESDIIQALQQVVDHISAKFGKRVSLVHEPQWYLRDIVAELRQTYPDVEFHYHFDSSSIRPDGGILYIRGKPDDELTYPILIAEVKNQEQMTFVPLKGSQDRREEMLSSVLARTLLAFVQHLCVRASSPLCVSAMDVILRQIPRFWTG